jgi:hypothetical protein
MANIAGTVRTMEEQERRDAYAPLVAHSIDHSWWIVVHLPWGGENNGSGRGGVEVLRSSDRHKNF